MEHLHSVEKEKEHSAVMLIGIILDAQMTRNQEVDWSSPSEKGISGDRATCSPLHRARRIPKTILLVVGI